MSDTSITKDRQPGLNGTHLGCANVQKRLLKIKLHPSRRLLQIWHRTNQISQKTKKQKKKKNTLPDFFSVGFFDGVGSVFAYEVNIWSSIEFKS